MSGRRTLSIAANHARPQTFDVVVREDGTETRHEVTFSAEDAGRWGKLGASPAQGVEAAMRFLLDREPKESILAAFDIGVIQRYFPEFNHAFPEYVERVGGDDGKSGQAVSRGGKLS